MQFIANYRTALGALKVEVILIVLYAVLTKYERVEETTMRDTTNETFDKAPGITIYPYDFLSHVHAWW